MGEPGINVFRSGGTLGLFIVFLVVLILEDLMLVSSTATDRSQPPIPSSSVLVENLLPKNRMSTNIRLPRALLPHHYDVRLFPVLENGNFSILGCVTIDMNCHEETDRIILHSADIVVDPKSIRLVQTGNNSNNNHLFELDDIEYNTELEFLVIPLSSKRSKQKLIKGLSYVLSMEFVGDLNDELKGFYRSSYTEDGVER